MDYRCDPINFPTELNLGHKTKVIEQHNRTEKQKRVEQQMPIKEKKRIVPVFTEKSVKAAPTAPLCRQRVVYRGGKRYRVKMHRVRMHSYPVQGYDV
jgi:hypothetical protein